jgi:hypothetical protein|tara:strand:- start:44 stop:1840 length:1797 start_codon:yes stop_codon:yes gene_type:complete
MSEEKYTIDMIEEESIVGDWLIANENMLDSDNPQDVKDFNDMRDYYRDLEGYYATPKGFISTAIPAAGGEISTVAQAAWKAAQNPVDSTKNLIGGVGDIATTAATNLLPEDVVDDLFSYENDPNSAGYKLNERLKKPVPIPFFGDADFSFLATQPREQYEKIGGLISEDFSNIKEKLSSPDTAAKLIAQNPLESLMNFTGLGSILKYPIKKAGLLNSPTGKVVDNITNQSPTSLISAGPQILKSKANKKGDALAASRVKSDAIIKQGVEVGYILPPSAYQGAGDLSKLGKLSEKIPFIGNRTKGTAISRNQINSNKLAREYTNVPKDTPLEDILDIVKTRSSPAYNNIGKLKGVKKSTKETSYVDGKIIGADGKYNKIPKTNIKTKVLHRDGSKILKDLKSSRDKQNKLYKKGEYDDFLEQKLKTDSFENELTKLGQYHKKPNLLKDFDLARKDYSKAYSVVPYVSDANLNVVAFAKANKANTALTGKGKIMKEFAELNSTKPSLIIPKPEGASMSPLEKYALTGIAFADLGTASAILGASQTLPSLLLNAASQRKFLDPKYGAGGLLSTLGNTTAVRNAVIVPTLLEQSGIKDVEYL